ncbi:MAG TPA: exodeoxyribonuclease VII large subunit [Usitatibacter sp.]|nr:exodeoxyribonuclease VII large subunit [Usitatibacter sp.]
MTASLFPDAPPVISVTELNRRARNLLENHFEMQWVAGEISNVKKAPSGHWYFALKDAAASVDCAMYQSRARFLDFRPENGQQVEVRARVTLYEARGAFQLSVDEMRKAGLGALYEAFERLKARLEKEGLFDPARKKPVPAFPRAIGIVTSPAAAALRDVLTTLARRAPMVPLVIYPAQVQGEGAAAQIAGAVRVANARSEVDVILVCRGGGSLEDLWAFNEEVVARSIAASRIPVVSGVGHETDFTIADFVADVRAPTPTAAAALASPDRADLVERVSVFERRLLRDMRRVFEVRAQRLDLASRRLLTPAERIERSRERLAQLFRAIRRALPDVAAQRRVNARFREQLSACLQRRLREHARHVVALGDALSHLDPNQVLGRGYSIVRDASGHVRATSAGLEAGDALDITFSEGGAAATVREPRPR